MESSLKVWHSHSTEASMVDKRKMVTDSLRKEGMMRLLSKKREEFLNGTSVLDSTSIQFNFHNRINIEERLNDFLTELTPTSNTSQLIEFTKVAGYYKRHGSPKDIKNFNEIVEKMNVLGTFSEFLRNTDPTFLNQAIFGLSMILEIWTDKTYGAFFKAGLGDSLFSLVVNSSFDKNSGEVESNSILLLSILLTSNRSALATFESSQAEAIIETIKQALDFEEFQEKGLFLLRTLLSEKGTEFFKAVDTSVIELLALHFKKTKNLEHISLIASIINSFASISSSVIDENPYAEIFKVLDHHNFYNLVLDNLKEHFTTSSTAEELLDILSSATSFRNFPEIDSKMASIPDFSKILSQVFIGTDSRKIQYAVAFAANNLIRCGGRRIALELAANPQFWSEIEQLLITLLPEKDQKVKELIMRMAHNLLIELNVEEIETFMGKKSVDCIDQLCCIMRSQPFRSASFLEAALATLLALLEKLENAGKVEEGVSIIVIRYDEMFEKLSSLDDARFKEIKRLADEIESRFLSVYFLSNS